MEAVKLTSRLTSWGALAALLAALAFEAIFYPQIATWLYIVVSRRTGWDGTGLEYVQWRLAIPVAAALACLLLALAGWMTLRRRSIKTVVLLGWAVNLALLTLSIAWYSRLADKG